MNRQLGGSFIDNRLILSDHHSCDNDKPLNVFNCWCVAIKNQSKDASNELFQSCIENLPENCTLYNIANITRTIPVLEAQWQLQHTSINSRYLKIFLKICILMKFIFTYLKVKHLYLTYLVVCKIEFLCVKRYFTSNIISAAKTSNSNLFLFRRQQLHSIKYYLCCQNFYF